jgi:hypothetical protein
VLGYRNERKVRQLAERGKGRLRVVDASRAYFRVGPNEAEPRPLFEALQHLLRLA